MPIDCRVTARGRDQVHWLAIRRSKTVSERFDPSDLLVGELAPVLRIHERFCGSAPGVGVSDVQDEGGRVKVFFLRDSGSSGLSLN